MKLLSTAPPVFSSDVSGMSVTMKGNAEVYVITNDNTTVPVFTVSLVRKSQGDQLS